MIEHHDIEVEQPTEEDIVSKDEDTKSTEPRDASKAEDITVIGGVCDHNDHSVSTNQTLKMMIMLTMRTSMGTPIILHRQSPANENNAAVETTDDVQDESTGHAFKDSNISGNVADLVNSHSSDYVRDVNQSSSSFQVQEKADQPTWERGPARLGG